MLNVLQEGKVGQLISRANALLNSALHLASRDGGNLTLPVEEELPAKIQRRLLDACAQARDILVLGASTPDVAASLADLARTAGKSVKVIEEDKSLFDALTGNDPAAWEGICERGDMTDLRINSRMANDVIATHGIVDYRSMESARKQIEAIAEAFPLIAEETIDLVVLDLLANRLPADAFTRALNEAFRVLRRGGRVEVVAFLADEPFQPAKDTYWNRLEAISWPLETRIAEVVALAGFHGIGYGLLSERVVRIVKGSELRAFIVTAFKGKQGACLDFGHAVIYRGPWSQVHDDDAHRFVRGERTAVCAKTFKLLMEEPYKGQFIGLEPRIPITANNPPPFDCNTPAIRSPAVTKGHAPIQSAAASCCASADSKKGGCCG